jgi:SAM-dependent methyltransferase
LSDSSSDDEEFERRRAALLADDSLLGELGIAGSALAALKGHVDGDRGQDKTGTCGTPKMNGLDDGNDAQVVHAGPVREGHHVDVAPCLPGMPALGSKNADYCLKEYWDQRFEEEEEYDWLLTYHDLTATLLPLLEEACTATGKEPHELYVLVLGCGNSTFSADLYDGGYTNLVNIDFSATVIAKMASMHGDARPLMAWREMDMLDMASLDQGSFDVVIDKATMDALMVDEKDSWAPSDSCLIDGRVYCEQVSRVLRRPRPPSSVSASAAAATTPAPGESSQESQDTGGLFVMVSFQQPHFRTKYLMQAHHGTDLYAPSTGYCAAYGWVLDTPSPIRGIEGSLDYFAYTMRATTVEG